MKLHSKVATSAFAIVIGLLANSALAQSVCLPSPRLLTMTPMGATAGATVQVTITGQHLENVDELIFSHPKISSKPILAEGQFSTSEFEVTVESDCPVGVHEARVMSRLGLSTSRVFCVSDLPESTQTGSTTTVETAMPIEVNTICNATLAARAVNHYRFEAKKSQRLIIDCAAKGIDSKTNPVVIVADETGQDLQVERRGGAIDFTPERDGTFIVKVHDLTFKGGGEHFFRLSVRETAADAPIQRMAGTRQVNSFSWPPVGLSEQPNLVEVEPNDTDQAQAISLPCDIGGSFYPAADVDVYEFAAKKGQVWWVEVGSERLGRPTDPSIVVQKVGDDGALTDVVELLDIDSPIKRSSNGYSYDGPPYNSGSADILGKLEIPEDGKYRLRISDLFGGTRNDARNIYRLLIREAQPDFALVGWALHMNLRNGDRNALSKPMALRGGASMALEVVAVRRDGFNGAIELAMEGLPEGVTATGFAIPAGKSRGIMVLTADRNAPRGWANTKFFGKAEIDGTPVTRKCHLASMMWPVPNAWSEIPAPRLLADAPVSVGGSEFAALTIASKDEQVWEAKAGESLKIELSQVLREEFSGNNISLRTFGNGFEGTPAFDVSLKADRAEAVLDLAKLKTTPGEYTIAFYGSAVAKYRYHPDGVLAAEEKHKQAQEAAQSLEGAAGDAAEKKKAADAALTLAAKQLAAAKRLAQPKDIVDIYVSRPIKIRVQPADAK